MKAFECKQCGSCCYGEGGITVTGAEAGRIASFLGIATEAFLSAYCYSKNGRVYVSTGGDGFCVFYNQERQCLIHPVKPRPCAHWPFYAAILKDPGAWDLAKQACPGINPGCSHEDFRRESGE